MPMMGMGKLHEEIILYGYDNVPMSIGILQAYSEKMNHILCDISDDDIERIVATPSTMLLRE